MTEGTGALTAPRVAVITGGGSGVGRAAALALAADGFHVVVSGRHLETLEKSRRAVLAEGGVATSIHCDVTDETSVCRLFEQVRDELSRVDLLFNNAGVNSRALPVGDVSLEDWERAVATNLTGVFLCTREAFRIMRDQIPVGGRIINNGSISAHTPRPGSAAYTATKHAITGLTKATALDGRPHRIACGQIDIGNAATAMTGRMAEGIVQADGSVRAEPTMDVADVGRAVAHMASLPLDANVFTMTLMATAMPYVGRG